MGIWILLAVAIVVLVLGLWRLSYRSREAEEETADMPGGGPGTTYFSVIARRIARGREGHGFKW